MLKLHYAPQTRAFTALWMLEEIGEPYTLVPVDIRAPGHPDAALRAVNPMGKLPALEHDGSAFGESAAVLAYLADRFPGAGLAPAVDDPRRGRYLQWLLFTPACIEPAVMERARQLEPNTLSAGWGDAGRVLDVLDAALAVPEWLFGAQFTAADLYLASTLGFLMQFGLVEHRPNFDAFATRGAARPAFQRATAIEAARGAG